MELDGGVPMSLCVRTVQYLVWREVLKPRLDADKRKEDEHEDFVWQTAAKERARLGLHAPRRPTKENAWRLEQIYDDD